MTNQQQVLSSSPQAMESLKSIFDTFDSQWRKLKAESGQPRANVKRLEVQTPEGTIWFPTAWQDVTLDQFIRIRKTDHAANQVLAVLASNSEILSRLSPDAIRQIIQALPFLKTPVPMDFPAPIEVTIRGHVIQLPKDLTCLHTFGHIIAFETAMKGVADDGLDWMVPALCTLLNPLLSGIPNHPLFMGALIANPNVIAEDVRALPYWLAYPLAVRYMEVVSNAEPLEKANATIITEVIEPGPQKRTLFQWLTGMFKRKDSPGWASVRLNVTKEQAREIERVENIRKQKREERQRA